jgi:hypothetical protein
MPYCSEGEFERSKADAMAVLAQSGFRQARKLVVSIHDEYKARARRQEELAAKSPDNPEPF